MKKHRRPEAFPSLICADPYNLEQSVRELEGAGCRTLHVDILDGHFSPSMPLGLDAIAGVRRHSDMKMDVHIMSDINEFFVREMLRIGCDRICFHIETARHPDYLIRLIREEGVEAGIALKPSTPVWMLKELGECLDFVLLMLINPGYAGSGTESQVCYAARKVRECSRFLEENGWDIPIEVDGRITFDNLPTLLDAGAVEFVGGTGTYFWKQATLTENKQHLDEIFANYGG